MGDTMMWRIEFSSAKFLPTLPAACQSNPGVYGFELALWLAQELGRRGIATSYPAPEDWGWLIEYNLPEESSFLIGCASMCGPHDGYDGEALDWSIVIEEHRSMKQRIRNLSSRGELEVLSGHIIGILEQERIPPAHVGA
jgi:hypothetical protein